MIAILRSMKKVLHKSENKKLEGVCSGVAEYFNQDPTLVRAGYVLLTIFTGIIPGLVAYITLAVIMPSKNEAEQAVKKTKKNVIDL